MMTTLYDLGTTLVIITKQHVFGQDFNRTEFSMCGNVHSKRFYYLRQKVVSLTRDPPAPSEDSIQRWHDVKPEKSSSFVAFFL